MESEKVKEIKKGLEFMIKLDLSNKLPYIDGYTPKQIAYEEIFNYIIELESDNERLKTVVDIANERAYRKKFINEWRKEYQKELDKQGNGHIAGYPDFDLVYKLYFEQKDRIAELEKGNEEKYKRIMELEQDLVYADENVFFRECNVALNEKEIKAEALKQFAERLKEYIEHHHGNYGDLSYSECVHIIDETLKEFIDEQD